MLKKILGILAVILTLGYMGFVLVTYSGMPSAQRCRKVVIEVRDSVSNSYVSSSEIREMLAWNNLELPGKKMSDISFRRLEHVVEAHRMVRRAECFSSPSGNVIVYVWQYHPVIRIVSADSSYYLDENGQKTRVSYRSAADVPIATGNVDDSLQLKRLHTMALLLRKDPFWNAQIQQIEVLPNGEWMLIPRIGNQELYLGLPNDLEDKLYRLKLFYQKVLPKMGWERYSRISVKYDKQIIGTLK